MNTPTAIAFLKGKCITMRAPEERDVEQLHAWMNSPELLAFLGAWRPLSLNAEREWVTGLAKDNTQLVFVIEVDGKLIGTMGLHDIKWKNRTAVSGSFIGDPTMRGKGYGTDAKMQLLRFAFCEMGLRKVKALVLASNERSLRCQLRCGYKIEGTLIGEEYRNGRYVNMHTLGVFQHTWRRAFKKYERGEFKIG